MNSPLSSNSDRLILVLIGTVVVLIVMSIGLFLRVQELGKAIQPLQALQPPEGIPVGTEAPPFSLVDSNDQVVSLDQYLGERVLLVFSSVTCPACRNLYPHLKNFSEAHPELSILMLSEGSFEENRRVTLHYDFIYPLLNLEEEVKVAYQEPGTPYFFLIDAEGVIEFRGFVLSYADMERILIR